MGSPASGFGAPDAAPAPAAADLSAAEPVTAEPVADLSAAEPVTAEPVAAEPVSAVDPQGKRGRRAGEKPRMPSWDDILLGVRHKSD